MAKTRTEIERFADDEKDARACARFFFSCATEVALDKQGRIHIPSTRIQDANLEKECVVFGVSSKIEILAKDAWGEYFEQSAQSFKDIAENMIDFDFLGQGKRSLEHVRSYNRIIEGNC